MMEIIMVLGIITLCICNLTVLGLITFIILSKKNSVTSGLKTNNDTPVPLSEFEKIEQEKQKQKYEKSQEAFEQMMNYNAYVAYGMDQPNNSEE